MNQNHSLNKIASTCQSHSALEAIKIVSLTLLLLSVCFFFFWGGGVYMHPQYEMARSVTMSENTRFHNSFTDDRVFELSGCSFCFVFVVV